MANPQPTAAAVTIVNTGSGAVHVHQAGCADLNRIRYRKVAGRWTLTAAARRVVVCHVFEGFEALQDDGANWSDLADAEDLHFFPCCRLPDEPGGPARAPPAHRNAETAT